MKFIPDDINVDFMAARKKAFILSGILVTASLIGVIAMGLNLGIDFKGGSAVIVAFEKDSLSDRDKLRDATAALLEEEKIGHGSEVNVQGFGAGAGDEVTHCAPVLDAEGKPTRGANGQVVETCKTVPVDRFRIYTEVTSLITPKRREEIKSLLVTRFGEGTTVESRDESDTFRLSLPTSAVIEARQAEIQAAFKDMGFASTSISSEFERALEVEFWREVQLLRSDNRERKKSGEQEFVLPTQADYEARRESELAGKKDSVFTVHVEELRAKVTEKFDKEFKGTFVQVESATTVSASVGKDLLNNGLVAILYALIGILIYITVRFDFRYAPGAVVALAHDVTITLGIFAFAQVKFSLPIIAALLTIVGYSLNDTIIVLDRVRETFEAFRGRSMKDLLNRAINSTLSRTVLTSLTTLMVVVAILIFGGGSIRDFAWALLIGIVVGTYSSIFVASPLVYYMDQYLTRREEQKTPDRSGSNKGGGGKNRAKATA